MIEINSYLKLAADVIMMIHFGFVIFVVLSVPVIWIGFFMKKQFVHNPMFRIGHLLVMGIVLAQSIGGVICPLTTWEMVLRLKAGQGQVYVGSFIQHWVHKVLFFQGSMVIFTWIYGVFFVLIVSSIVFVKPNWWWQRNRLD